MIWWDDQFSTSRDGDIIKIDHYKLVNQAMEFNAHGSLEGLSNFD